MTIYDVSRSQYLRTIDLYIKEYGLPCQIFTATITMDQYGDPVIEDESYIESQVMLGGPLVTLIGYPVDYIEDNIPIPAAFPSSVTVEMDWTVRVQQKLEDKIHWHYYIISDRKTDAYLGLPVLYYLTPLRRSPTDVEDSATPTDEGNVIGY